ncbi:MAG: hypothetical protein NTY65_02395 [Planctomycetota bacterium]|nr:hypothetical protein [Planctomycetota bacterium]
MEPDNASPSLPADNTQLSTQDLKVPGVDGKDSGPRFGDYMALYNSLDKILWGIPAFVIMVTLTGLLAFGEKFSKPDSRLFTLSHEMSVTVICGMICVLYLVGAYCIYRLRKHHTRAGEHLQHLESGDKVPEPYFKRRLVTAKQWWWGAPSFVAGACVVFAVLAALGAIAPWLGKDAAETMRTPAQGEGKMERMPGDYIGRYGMYNNHERMDNGEMRFRLMSTDGSGYIRTVAGAAGAWQNSHSHAHIVETYIVQTGWMVLAELRNGQLVPLKLEPREIVTTEIGVIHNVYLPPHAVIHTVKHGDWPEEDWIQSHEFDEMTKHLSEEEILRLVERAQGSPPHEATR